MGFYLVVELQSVTVPCARKVASETVPYASKQIPHTSRILQPNFECHCSYDKTNRGRAHVIRGQNHVTL
jgi:hypothetical protein